MRLPFIALAALISVAASETQAADSEAFALVRQMCVDTVADAKVVLAKADAQGWRSPPEGVIKPTEGLKGARFKFGSDGPRVVTVAAGDDMIADRLVSTELCMLAVPQTSGPQLREEIQAYAGGNPLPSGNGEMWAFIDGDERRAATLWDPEAIAALQGGRLRILLFEKHANNGSFSVGYTVPKP